jgi:alpha-methylacyl-CoA racemase
MRVLEIGTQGPGPICAMMLADHGADILRIDRGAGEKSVDSEARYRQGIYLRGRMSIALDLRHPDSATLILDLIKTADALIEGFRPGVAERLGFGPAVCLARNARLVYGRVTGYGQTGPRAQTPGYDLNYVAASGVLSMIGRKDAPPTPPLNLVGDAGGGLLLAFGVLAAIVHARQTGRGQVVDAAMTEGAALLAAPLFAAQESGSWSTKRGANMFDSGAPFYDSYETADGRWLSVAAVGPQFYDALLDMLGLDKRGLPDQNDRGAWPAMKQQFAKIIRTRDRAEWCSHPGSIQACVAPVLELDDLEADDHLRHRAVFLRREGVLQPAPAPRLSETPAELSLPPPMPGEHNRSALLDWGIKAERIDELELCGALSAR